MTVFVAHKQASHSKAKSQKVVTKLQEENPTHCFIPASVAFEHLYCGNFSDNEIFEIECDLLCNCDQLLIISDVSPIIQRQIDFARMIGMEVIDLAEKFRQV